MRVRVRVRLRVKIRVRVRYVRFSRRPGLELGFTIWLRLGLGLGERGASFISTQTCMRDRVVRHVV